MGKERHFPIDSPEPIHGEITRGFLANPLLNRVFKEFGKRAFARSSACMEFESFLKRILPLGAETMTCLEIGTYHGITAVVLAQFFARVVCVSVDNDPKALMKREIVEFLGLQDRIIFHDCNDNVHKAEIIKATEFDFAYADGDHTHDARFDFDLVKRCGRVLFHEATPLQPPQWNVICGLPADEVTWADYDWLAYWERR